MRIQQTAQEQPDAALLASDLRDCARTLGVLADRLEREVA